MIKLYQKYSVSLYLKNFFIIFIALEFFYVGVDVITNFKDLPSSANLQILYVVFNFLTAVNYVLPISIIFAMITTKFHMIRTNELVSLYSIGVSRNALIKPIFLTALSIVFVYYGLNMSQFSYSYEYRSNILDNARLGSTSSELFLKHDNQYIYFEELNPYKQEVLDVKIFDIEDNELKSAISAISAKYISDEWVLQDVQIMTKPEIVSQNVAISIKMQDELAVLRGFRPSIIESAHQGKKSLSIPDAIEAIKFFKDQKVNIVPFKSNLYLMLFFPLYAPLMVLILYYYLPISGRFFDLALMSFVFVFIGLVGWGILYIVGKFSANSVISPEIGIILPIVFLSTLAIYLYRKNA
ncbi:MAG: LptF/LptG family permease [Campylobacteraceae bacterium]|jgi:lipopolysaccharide export system permease protein|nr:LptF/LptG family permease [Campylobacteraceae bacterium]